MDRTHPALHWAIIPAFFGVSLFVVLSLTFFLFDALGLIEFNIRPLGTVFLYLFGSACVGGLAGGVLYHNLPANRPARLRLCWAVSGLAWGAAMALLIPFLGPNDDPPSSDLRWVQAFMVTGGLLLGLLLGFNYARGTDSDRG